MVTRDEDSGPVDKVDECAEVLEGQITRRDHDVDPERRSPSHTEVGNLLVTDCQRPDHASHASVRMTADDVDNRDPDTRWNAVLPTGPGEHAGENWRSSGWGVEGVLSRGWRSRASRPGSQQAAPAGGKPRSRRHHTVRQRTGPAHRRLLGRSIRAVATPTSSKPRPTSDTRDAKTTMREVGSTTYDWTRLGPKIGRLALGCMSYGNPTTPSSKVATKEVLTTEN